MPHQAERSIFDRDVLPTQRACQIPSPVGQLRSAASDALAPSPAFLHRAASVACVGDVPALRRIGGLGERLNKNGVSRSVAAWSGFGASNRASGIDPADACPHLPTSPGSCASAWLQSSLHRAPGTLSQNEPRRAADGPHLHSWDRARCRSLRRATSPSCERRMSKPR